MTNPQSPICNSPASKRLEALVTKLRACTLCPKMHRPAVSGGAVVSRVMSVGQAPGVKEPVLGRPFAWTAGKTLYGWFTAACGWSEADFRARIYIPRSCCRSASSRSCSSSNLKNSPM
jgi:uracil-DNA glycosylase